MIIELIFLYKIGFFFISKFLVLGILNSEEEIFQNFCVMVLFQNNTMTQKSSIRFMRHGVIFEYLRYYNLYFFKLSLR